MRLAPPNAVLAEDLFGLTSGRELADGRLLIGEGSRLSRRLLVADFARGSVNQLGRRGFGPGEYQIVGTLFRLANDSTLFQADQARWLILAGSKIVHTISGNEPAMRSTSLLLGADSLGHLLSSDRSRAGADSVGRLLVSRTTGEVSLAAHLRASAEDGYPPPSTRNARGVKYFSGPLISTEDMYMFSDGWLAVARVQPYRVDWRTAEGRWLRGEPIQTAVVRINERQKVAYMRRIAERSGTPQKSPSAHPVWPREVPPFLLGALIGSGDGRLLILRTPTADEPEVRYDIVDRRGRLVQQLVLQPNQRILAFGSNSVYVTVTDEDDLQRVQRHVWPPR